MKRIVTRRGRSLSLAPALVLALLTLVGSGSAPTSAATLSPFTVSATPLTLTEGQATDVQLTVSAATGPGAAPIGCIVVTIPSGFSVLAASVVSVPVPGTWSATISGSGSSTLVTFATTNDPDRLQTKAGQNTGVFDIRVVATSSPLAAWTVAAYQKFTSSSPSSGLPLLPLQPFVIVPAATPSPSPTPVPTATPRPTPPPSPTPPVSPTPAPTPSPSSGLTPPPASGPPPSGAATAQPSTSAGGAATSPAPGASPSPSDSAGPGTVQAAGPAPSSGPGQAITFLGQGAGTGPAAAPPRRFAVPDLASGQAVPFDGLGLAGTLSLFLWLVPGLSLSLPGLLILVVIAAQALGAGSFVPLTWRVLGGFGWRRRGRGRDRH
jgi:hypothetical protein